MEINKREKKRHKKTQTQEEEKKNGTCNMRLTSKAPTQALRIFHESFIILIGARYVYSYTVILSGLSISEESENTKERKELRMD